MIALILLGVIGIAGIMTAGIRVVGRFLTWLAREGCGSIRSSIRLDMDVRGQVEG